MKNKLANSSFQQMSSERKLESVFLFVTGRCNAKCAMCFYADEMDKKETDLTFDEIRKLSESAGEFNRLWLSGGEPTMRDDLPQIVEIFYINNKIKDINFPTNGLRPERAVEWIKYLREKCPGLAITVSVSADGFGDTHDKQRGVPGNFYKALETLKRVDEAFGNDPKVLKNVATVITRYNMEEVIDFMVWAYGRLHISTHTVEAARGTTREDDVKVLTEETLRELQDKIAPVYLAYAERMGKNRGWLKRVMIKVFYVGLMRTMYNIRASNIDKPTPWDMDCTAGETTLVIDYDGRFRSCELREPIGHVKDYDFDISRIMKGDSMKNEIDEIGYGYKANCWCTHGCWIMSSIVFNPKKMISKVYRGYRETKKLSKQSAPVIVREDILRGLEDKYSLDTNKLTEIGII